MAHPQSSSLEMQSDTIPRCALEDLSVLITLRPSALARCLRETRSFAELMSAQRVLCLHDWRYVPDDMPFGGASHHSPHAWSESRRGCLRLCTEWQYQETLVGRCNTKWCQSHRYQAIPCSAELSEACRDATEVVGFAGVGKSLLIQQGFLDSAL